VSVSVVVETTVSVLTDVVPGTVQQSACVLYTAKADMKIKAEYMRTRQTIIGLRLVGRIEGLSNLRVSVMVS